MITIHHTPDQRGPCRGKPFTAILRDGVPGLPGPGQTIAILHLTRAELEALADQLLHALQANEVHAAEDIASIEFPGHFRSLQVSGFKFQPSK